MTTQSPPSRRRWPPRQWPWVDGYDANGGLWRNPAFLRLWLANAIDDYGTQISGLAVPLTAAVVLGAGPVQMGLLAAAQRLPYFLFGLLAGVLVDRRPPQQLMTIVNWGRAALLALVPIAAVAGMLSLELLFVVVLATGSCGIIFDVAYHAWLPSLVPGPSLHDANGKMIATGSSAQAAGPGIAGILAGAIGAPLAIGADALSFVVSALLIQGIRPPSGVDGYSEAASESPAIAPRVGAVGHDIAAGLRVVWRDSLVRATVLCNVVVSFFGYAFLAVYILYMVDVLGLGAGGIGVVLAAGGIGAVVGAAAAVRLSQRYGFGLTMIWAQILFAVTGIAVPVAVFVPDLAMVMLAASEFTQYGALAIYTVGAVSLRQVRVPHPLQGRASATTQTATSGAAFTGSILGGVLGGWIGLGPTLVVGIAGMALACGLVILSPLRDLRHLSDAAPRPTGNAS